MSNKTQLQNNNTALDGYIARINAAKEVAAGLPEAGGGSVETCFVTIGIADGTMPPSSPPTIYYTDATTLTVKSITTTDDVLIVPVNSIIAMKNWSSMSSASSLCSQLFYGYQYSAYQINGNCTLLYAD